MSWGVVDGIAVLEDHVQHPQANEQGNALETVANLRVRAPHVDREAPGSRGRSHEDHESRGGGWHHVVGARWPKERPEREPGAARLGRGRAAKRLHGEKGEAQDGATGARAGDDLSHLRVVRPAQAGVPSRSHLQRQSIRSF